MTEFKQIVGRGTRVHEDTGKFYFTLIDFRGATGHFADPEFDGEPEQIYEPGPDDPVLPPDPPPNGSNGPGEDEVVVNGGDTPGPTPTGPLKKIYVDGIEATVVAERVEYLDRDGKLITESLRDFTRRALRRRFASLDDFLNRWNGEERKHAILDEMASEGLPVTEIVQELGKDLDPFDLICHIAFDAKPLTRRERAESVKRRDVFTRYAGQARAVLDALLDKYADDGVLNLGDAKVLSDPTSRQPRHAARTCSRLWWEARLRAGRARSSIRTLPGERLRHVRRHPRQVHSEHHAPGRGRGRRRPTHQPAVLDVLPQDHRRSGPGARNLQTTATARRSPPALRWRNWAADPEGITGDELLGFVNGDLFPQLKDSRPGRPPCERVVRDVFEDAYNYMKSGHLLRQVVNKINGIDFNNLADRRHFGDIYEQILNDLQSAGNAGEYYTPRAVTSFMARMIDPKPGETLLDPACGTGGFLTCAIRHMREHHVKRPEDRARMQASLRAVEKKPLPHMLAVTNMLLHGIEDPSFLRHDNTLARPYISWGRDERVDIVLTNPPFGGKEEDGIESNFPPHFRTRETADLFLALIIRLLKPGGRAAVVLPDGSMFGEGVKTRLKEHLMEECNLHTIVRLPNSVFRPYASIGTNLLFFEKGEPTKESGSGSISCRRARRRIP